MYPSKFFLLFLSIAEGEEAQVIEDMYYECSYAWANDGKDEKSQKFFEASQAIKEKYGRPAPIFHIQFQPAINRHEAPFFTPSMGGLVEWNHYLDADVLLGNEEFQLLAAPLFGEAISRMEMVLGKVVEL